MCHVNIITCHRSLNLDRSLLCSHVARENAQKAFDIVFHGCKVRNLYWRTMSKKGTKVIYPVRVVPRDETVGLMLKDYNGDTECPVQYIQYPHPQIKGHDIGQYDIATKKSLTHYHGDGDDENVWCATKIEQYLKQLKRAHKILQPVDLKTEECFLQIVLQKSLLEVEQDAKRAEVDEAVPEEISPTNQEEQRVESDSEDDDAHANPTGRSRRTRGSSNGVQERTERLRVGDQIAFYTQMGVAGDVSAYREATIHGIDPKAEHILTIDDAFTNLQPDHQVKRIKRLHRGKLVDNDGQWQSINKYILKKEGDPDAYRKVLAGEHARMNEIRDRHKEEMITKMEADGFCPKDLLR